MKWRQEYNHPLMIASDMLIIPDVSSTNGGDLQNNQKMDIEKTEGEDRIFNNYSRKEGGKPDMD